MIRCLAFLLAIAWCGEVFAQKINVLQMEIPFEKLRAFMPDDGDIIELHRKKDVWTDRQGEERDEWLQLSFGKNLKARLSDRTSEKETSLGDGIVAKDGFVEILAGWRARLNQPLENDFDGTISARVSVLMTNGHFSLRFDRFEFHWNAGPIVSEVGSAIVAPMIREKAQSELNGRLNDAIRQFMKDQSLISEILPQLSALLVGRNLIISTQHGIGLPTGSVAVPNHVPLIPPNPIQPLLDLGRIIDRRGDQRVVVEAATYDKLKVLVVDRSEVDTTAATVLSSIEVPEKIDGQSVVKLRVAPGASVIIYGKVDGQSTLIIDAPGGHVEFRDEINGQSHIHVTAKSVVFHKKIDGGWSGNRITSVYLTLANDGWVTIPELYAHLFWSRVGPDGAAPTITVGTRGWAWKIQELRKPK